MMEEVKIGCAAIPKNGRYAGRPMVVISVGGIFAEVCDGKRRRLAKPKRKKLRHLSFLKGFPPLDLSQGVTDGDVRRFLAGVRASDPNKNNGMI